MRHVGVTVKIDYYVVGGPGQANEAFVNWDRVACTSDICPPNVPGAYTVSVTWNEGDGAHTIRFRTLREGP